MKQTNKEKIRVRCIVLFYIFCASVALGLVGVYGFLVPMLISAKDWGAVGAGVGIGLLVPAILFLVITGERLRNLLHKIFN